MRRHKNRAWIVVPDNRQIEVGQRADRVLSFLLEREPPTNYKSIMVNLGLSYMQTIEAVTFLERLGLVHVSVISQWNGMHYIYPHHVWVDE